MGHAGTAFLPLDFRHNFERLATRVVKQRLERAAPALVKPYDIKQGEWLQEDYFIFHVRRSKARRRRTTCWLRTEIRFRRWCAAKRQRFRWRAPGNFAVADFLLSQRSGVIGWNAAFIYDDPWARRPPSSFCNTQTRSYSSSATTTNCSPRNWKTSTTSSKLAGRDGVALAHGEGRVQAAHRLARRERTHGTRRQRHQVPQRHVLRAPIQMAASKVGVPDYKDLVKENCKPLKISTAHGRPVQPEPRFVLELMWWSSSSSNWSTSSAANRSSKISNQRFQEKMASTVETGPWLLHPRFPHC